MRASFDGHVLLLDDRLAALDALPAVVERLLVAGPDGAQVDRGAQQAERRRGARAVLDQSFCGPPPPSPSEPQASPSLPMR